MIDSSTYLADFIRGIEASRLPQEQETLLDQNGESPCIAFFSRSASPAAGERPDAGRFGSKCSVVSINVARRAAAS